MPYFKVDDKLHDHRKSRRARKAPEGGRSAASIGLWTLAGSWCMANQTDGWVPTDELDRWDDQGEQLAEQLVAAELWHRAEHDGEPGYQFHEWDEWQHSVDYLNERRRRNAAQMRTRRANERAALEQAEQAADQDEPAVSAHTDDTAPALVELSGASVEHSNPTQPNPTEEKPPARKRAASPADKAGDDFTRFWDLYPRKTGKQDAARAFMRARQHTDVATIAEGLHNALAVWRSTEQPVEFIPHPATWLNQGRWDDEQPLPAEGMPKATPQSAMDLPPLPEPPEDVRDAGGKAYTDWAKQTRAEQRAALDAERGAA